MKKLGLIRNRHEMPVDDFIFETIDDVTDLDWLHQVSLDKLKCLSSDKLGIYVTGLSTALVAALNACRYLGINVELYHYNRDTDSYYAQQVL